MIINPKLLEKMEYPLESLNRRYNEYLLQGKDIINLTIGDPEDDSNPLARQATLDYLTKHKDSSYPPYLGTNQYRTAVKNWAKSEYAIDLDYEHDIICCNGTKEAIFSFPLCFDWTDNLRTIMFSSIAYPVYKMSASFLNIKSMPLSVSAESNFFPELEKIPDKDWEKCGVFWLNSPNNPTTAIASSQYISTLLNLAERFDFIVASDECYNDLYQNEKPTSCLDFPDSDRWVVFRSLSKRSHMTGYRCGAILSKNKQLMSSLKRLRSPMGVGTPLMVQTAGEAAWSDHDHIRTSRNNYREKRSALKAALEKQGFTIFAGEAGFYFWLSHSDMKSSDALAEWFLAKGLLVTPGHVFGSDGDGFIRLVYCIKDDKVSEVVKRIEADYQ